MNLNVLFFSFPQNFMLYNWQFQNHGKTAALSSNFSPPNKNSTLPWSNLYISHLKFLFTKSANHFTIELGTKKKKLSIKVVETPANYHLGMK